MMRPQSALVKHTHTNDEEIVSASYLVGCDGGKSFTRNKLAIPLIGDSVEISFYIMDVTYSKINIPTKDVMKYAFFFFMFFFPRVSKYLRFLHFSVFSKPISGA